MAEETRFDYVFLVSNDIQTDRRVLRITRTLWENGHKILIVGRVLPSSEKLELPHASVHRLRLIFSGGPLLYLELVLRMIFSLRKLSFKNIVAIDLDTILVAAVYQKWRDVKTYFDAHEYFSEVPELEGRPVKKGIWSFLGRKTVPRMDVCMTVNKTLAQILQSKYRKPFFVIRNLPYKSSFIPERSSGDFLRIIYVGVLNRGRGLPDIIRAMEDFPKAHLTLVGNGDIMGELVRLTEKLNLASRIVFKGKRDPAELSDYLQKADLGINLLDPRSLSYKASLANKVFDYIQHGLPVITMNFPEYKKLNTERECCLFLNDLNSDSIADLLKRILLHPELLSRMRSNCLLAREEYHWGKEEEKLLKVFGDPG